MWPRFVILEKKSEVAATVSQAWNAHMLHLLIVVKVDLFHGIVSDLDTLGLDKYAKVRLALEVLLALHPARALSSTLAHVLS